MPQVSADKRRERIRVLRSLGFTHQQAFRWNNAKGKNVQAVISQAKRDLESVPKAERTPAQTDRLKSFRGVPLRNNPRILSREEKRDQWSEWSGKSGMFPARGANRVRELNENAGKDEFDSFGFQAYYFEYVEDFDDVDDGDFYEEKR